MDWKFIMCLLVMCSTTIWKLLEILTYGEIQVRQVDDIMMMYMTFTIYAAYKAGMAVQAKKTKKPKKISQSPLIAKKENDSMYQLQNIDYLYRISTMTGSSKLVTVQADRDSHDLNDKHFVMLNLCRAIVNFANEGHVISAVYELEPDGTSKRVAYRGLPEYQEALKDPEPDVIVAKFATNFSSGASFASQCRVNQKSREVFDIEASGTPSDNDDISERLVSLDDGKHWHQVHCIDDILDEYDDDIDNALDALNSIEAHGDIDGDYWCTTTDKDLNRTIRECRTEILVDALLARGSEAVEEFLGYPVNMSEAECVLEEYLNNLSDEDLANAFFETL